MAIIKQNRSEKYIERKLVELVTSHGGMCIKLLSDYVTGLPDRLCLFPGRIAIFVELKSTGKKPRKIQIFMHNKLKALGFRVEVIDTSEGVKNFIESLQIDADRK